MEKKNSLVFVDANVLVALFNKDDALHQKARKLWGLLEEEHAQLCTSNLVVSEALTVLRMKAGKSKSLRFGDIILKQSRLLKILYLNEAHTRYSYGIFSQVPQKDFSFVDASIVAFAKKYNLKVATFDSILKKHLP